MKYKSVTEARAMPGIRLVLSAGFPAPWGQCVKKMLEYKGVPYVPVAQYVGEPNEALVEWTGHRNAPTLVYDDNPPLSRWQDLIQFAETYKPAPELLPTDSLSRVLVMGIVNELAGEGGFGWCRRLMLFEDAATTKAAAGEAVPPKVKTMMQQYGFVKEAVAVAPARVTDILRMLSKQLAAQRAKGREFLVGAHLSAADIYWACFSSMLEPLPDEICPMSPEMRADRIPKHPLLLAAKDPMLLEHRDRMFTQYLGPVTF
jgi:glutathione S-transferase